MKNKTMLLIILLILLQGCKKPEYIDANTCNTIDCDKFIDYNEELELNIVDEPELNKIITVNAKYNPGDYTGIIDFAIIIPEGYEYISGNKHFKGFAGKNQVLELSAIA